MRGSIAGLSLFALMSIASIASAAEPVTVAELGKACSNDIGNLHVELRATQIYASKLQAEVDALKKAAEPKVEEKKK